MSDGICPNCSSSGHEKCCSRCGAVLKVKRITAGSDFCTSKCEHAQVYEDKLSTAIENGEQTARLNASMGPSNDTPDALVELRAAELVDASWDSFTPEEQYGWLEACRIRDEYNLDAAQLAGFLARLIRFHEHDEEQP